MILKSKNSDKKNKQLQEKVGMTDEEFRKLVRPLFLAMYDNRLSTIFIKRNGSSCEIIIN